MPRAAEGTELLNVSCAKSNCGIWRRSPFILNAGVEMGVFIFAILSAIWSRHARCNARKDITPQNSGL